MAHQELIPRRPLATAPGGRLVLDPDSTRLLLRSVRNSIALWPLAHASPERWTERSSRLRFGRVETPIAPPRRGLSDDVQELAHPRQHSIAHGTSGGPQVGNRVRDPRELLAAAGPTYRLEALTL